jgi:hypothetical protein
VTYAFGQYSITGQIVQKDKTINSFTEALLIDKNSVAIVSTVLDDDGKFVLDVEKQGEYNFVVKFLDHILYEKIIQVSSNLNLGTIEVENTITLQEVVITNKKKLVEKKIDRLIFNVENTIATTGGDALDALKITPGVKVQNDNVSMIGKSSVSVLVDDKLIQLKQAELTDFLKSLSADNIKSIEVITTPPAKYDAVGNSGIINIKTKTAKKDSWNANIGASYLQRSRPDGSAFGNFNFNSRKWTISTSISSRNGKRYSEQDDYAYFPDALWYTSSPFLSHYKRFSGKLSIDYQINQNWKTGVQYMANINRNSVTDHPYTPVLDNNAGDILRYLKSDGNQKKSPDFQSVNYYNEFKLDSLGRKLLLIFDYFNFDNDDNRFYDGISIIHNPYSQQYYKGFNINAQNIQNYSGKVDVEFPLEVIDLSFGGKIATSKAKNDMNVFNSGLVDDPISITPETQTSFEYQENIQALYFSANKKLNDHWETQVGLRMEATQTTAHSLSLNQKNKNNYVKWFPSVFVNYTPDENSIFALNYSKRIERPSFAELNPNQWYLNPFQKVEGNPFLEPAYIDNVEFSYNYKSLENKVYYSNEQNLYGQIPVADPLTNQINFTNENYVNTQRIGVIESFAFDKFNWWTSINSVDVNYVQSKSFISILERNQNGWSSRLSTNDDFVLNKNETWLFNVNYWYSFNGIDGKFYNIGSMSNLSITLQHLLMDKNLKISLKANDIFRTEKFKVNSTVNGVFQKGIYYHDNQYVQLNISYRFGNKKIKPAQISTGNEDERNRTGN